MFWRNFKRNEQGVAAIEFAMLLPVIILIFVGTVEVSRYVLMNQKVENAAHSVVDIINRHFQITGDDIERIVNTVPLMVEPFDSAGVEVVITSIHVPEGETEPTTKWQCDFSSGKSLVSSGEGAIPNLPQLELEERDQIITGEIFIKYDPIMDNKIVRDTLGLTTEGMYKIHIARPRFGAFELDPDC